MRTTVDDLLRHLLSRLRQVQTVLELEPATAAAVDDRLSDHLDSMGRVELLALLAEDYGVSPELLDANMQHDGATLRHLAETLHQAGFHLQGDHAGTEIENEPAALPMSTAALGWLSAMTLRLPTTIQPASQLDKMLNRPQGWFHKHAGIRGRHIWAEEDPLQMAVENGQACLAKLGLAACDVDLLLVTSEAPPQPLGLAALLHHGLELPPETASLEVGGACTGFVNALWLCRHLLPHKEIILIMALEAPSRYLRVKPGAAGEAAALFGDGTAACVASKYPLARRSLPLQGVEIQASGKLAHLLQADTSAGEIELHMNGPQLALRAVRIMVDNARDMADRHALRMADLQAVIVHGGNGRMPALIARELRIAADHVWSQTPAVGNLGSASLPAAFVSHEEKLHGPILWTAVGAGLTSAVVLTGTPQIEK